MITNCRRRLRCRGSILVWQDCINAVIGLGIMTSIAYFVVLNEY